MLEFFLWLLTVEGILIGGTYCTHKFLYCPTEELELSCIYYGLFLMVIFFLWWLMALIKIKALTMIQ